MARCAQSQLNAQQVWFLPAGEPWQKKGQLIANPEQRKQMLELAIAETGSWRLEPYELQHQGPTYTLNTLKGLTAQHPHHRFVFLIGSDQLLHLTTWKNWQNLFEFAQFGVLDRNTNGAFNVPSDLRDAFNHNRLFRIPMQEIAVSSSQIREQFTLLNNPNLNIQKNARLFLQANLPGPVWKYLQENPVYTGNRVQ